VTTPRFLRSSPPAGVLPGDFERTPAKVLRLRTLNSFFSTTTGSRPFPEILLQPLEYPFFQPRFFLRARTVLSMVAG